MAKTVRSKKSMIVSKNDTLFNLAFWSFSILMVASLFFRGLYFSYDQQRALIAISLIFCLTYFYFWNKREAFFKNSVLDWSIAALLLVYILSAFSAVNYGLAVDEIVKNFILVFTFFIVSRLIKDEKAALKLLHIIYLGGLAVSVLGLAVATNIVFYNGGYENARICSSLQYPNALGSFLLAVAIIGFTLWERSAIKQFNNGVPELNQTGKKLPGGINLLYPLANYLILTVLWGTKSKGSILVFLFVLFVFLIFKDRFTRLTLGFHIMTMFIITYPVMGLFIGAVEGKSFFVAWLWVLAGAVAVLLVDRVAVSMIIPRFSEVIKKVPMTRLELPALVSLISGLAVILLLNISYLRRVTEFSYLFDAYSRLYFIKDAMGMIKQKPLLGWGGGGWQEAHHAFQSYSYNASTVHSHLFQVGVETGIPGMAVFIAIGVSFMAISIKLFRDSRDNKQLQSLIWCITVATLGIQLHSLIDFDLSLIALAMILWTLMGINAGIYGRAEEQKNEAKPKHPEKQLYKLVSISLLVAITVLAGASLASSSSHAGYASRYLRSNINNYTATMEKAEKYNPFDPDIKSSLAQVYYALGRGAEAYEKGTEGTRLSQYNPVRQLDLIKMALSIDRKDAYLHAEKAVEMAPYNIDMYSYKANNYLIFGLKELEGGNRDMARKFFEITVGVPGLMQEKAASLGEMEKKLWRDFDGFMPNNAIKLNVGIAHYFLGNLDRANEYLLSVGEEAKEKPDAYTWLSLLERKRGNSSEADRLFNLATEKRSMMVKDYGRLAAMGTL